MFSIYITLGIKESQVNTKRYLAKYLGCKITQVLLAAGKGLVVAYNNTDKSNIVDFFQTN